MQSQLSALYFISEMGSFHPWEKNWQSIKAKKIICMDSMKGNMNGLLLFYLAQRKNMNFFLDLLQVIFHWFGFKWFFIDSALSAFSLTRL